MAHAYHSVVKALWQPRQHPLETLVMQLRGTLDALMPYPFFHELGVRLEGQRVSETELWARTRTWRALDINPLYLCALFAGASHAKMAVYNEFNVRADLGIKTVLSAGVDPGAPGWVARRELVHVARDTYPCMHASLNALTYAVEAGRPSCGEVTVLSLLEKVGAGHAKARDVLEALEEEPSLKLRELSKGVGVSLRTLQRQLEREGMSFELLASATKLNRATRLLPGPASLTEIAFESGYADLAHMTRAFVKSCRVPPSRLRALIQLGAG